MAEKAGKGLLLFLNGLGLVCLVYYGRLLILHEPEVLNPDAMLPMAGWEAGGLALTISFVPLLAVNLLAFMLLGKGERTKKIRILFFLPGLLCLFLVMWFWILSLS